MKLSIDNGATYTTPEKALEAVGMDMLALYMDDATREEINSKYAPCTDAEFVARYLDAAPADLIIG